jgi:N-(2-amino-2-carboxyethyl)-L-glutamate synthase
MNQDIFSCIGNTPLVRLDKLVGDAHLQLYAKLEGLNLGGSIKDRAAKEIIQDALERGKIHANTVVIESSSGNMGIGLAQVCAHLGLRFICVVDPKTTGQNIKILKAYGAEIDMVERPDPTTGEYLKARLDRLQVLLQATPNSFWPDQYSNVSNPRAHHKTMREIIEQLGARLDFVFCATSTCGTLRGCAEYLRARDLPAQVIAVDAVGSVIFGGEPAKRLIPGHGAAVRPRLYQSGLAARLVRVTDLDCVVGCRRLVRQEAILAGGSSGAVVMAVEKIKHELPPGAVCAAILPDRGERYLDTIYSDAWVTEHFGEVSHLWCGAGQKEELCLTAR